MEISEIRQRLGPHLGHRIDQDMTAEVDLARRILTDLTMSDIGGAMVSPVSAQRDIWLYSAATGTWSPLGDDLFCAIVQMYADTPVVGMKKGKEVYSRLRLSAGKTTGVWRSALQCYDVLKPDFFMKAKPGIAFENGYVTVTKEGIEFLPHSPDNRAVYGLPYRYESQPDEPEAWYQVLENVFGDDEDEEDKKRCLQEFTGANLAGLATQYARCMLMLGGGSNGKSTVSETISELLFPPELVTNVPPQSWGREYNVARLRHSAINVASEIPESDILNSATFKGILTGDPTEAREPYGKPFSFVPRAGHLFSANRLPGTVDHSQGFWRRFLVLRFNANFAKKKNMLTKDDVKQKLERDRAGIMAWGLEGAVRLQRQGGYTIPASHETELDEWQSDNNSVKAFVEDVCRQTGESCDGASLGTVHGAFRDWCERKGRKGMSDRGLAKRLREIGYSSVRLADGYTFNLQVRPRGEWRNW